MVVDTETKIKAFQNLLTDPDIIARFLPQVEATEKAAEKAGVAFKEEKGGTTTKEGGEKDGEKGKEKTSQKAGKKMLEKEPDPEDMTDEEDTEEENPNLAPPFKKGGKKETATATKAAGEYEYVGDMSPRDFTIFLTQVLRATQTKESGALAEAFKEYQESSETALTEVRTALTETQKELTALKEAIGELTGQQPAGFRATQSGTNTDNVIQSLATASKAVGMESVDQFISELAKAARPS